MTAIEAFGWFWSPDAPDARVPGVLTFNQDDGGKLRFLGRLAGADIFDSPNEHLRILGEAGGSWYTLEDCFVIRSTADPDAASVVRVSRIFEDFHPDGNEAIQFRSVSCGLAGLHEWIGRSGLTQDTTFDPEGPRRYEIGVAQLPTLSRQTDGEVVALVHGIGADLGGLTGSVRENHTVRVATEIPVASADLTQSISNIQDLVSIGTHRVAHYNRLDFREDPDSGPAARLLAQWKASPHEYRTEVHPSNCVFTFGDIGGMDGLGRWVDVARRHRYRLDVVMGTRYLRSSVVDDRLIHRVSSLEELHRQIAGANGHLAHRLRELAEHAGAEFAEAVGDVQAWSRAMKQARNEVGHREGKYAPGGPTIHYLAESAYWLFVLCLMREAAFPSSAFARAFANRQFVFDHERLRGLLT